MANELTLTASMLFDKGGVTPKLTASIQATITGDAYTRGVQTVGTTEEELVQGADLGTPGFVMIKNLDATNYVEIGATTGVYGIKLKAGEFALYRHNSATVFAKANTTACNVEFFIVED